MGSLGSAIKTWSNIDPHLLMLIFLPALIFEGAFSSDWHIFKVEFFQVLILAGPMLIGAAALTACMMKLFYDLPWSSALLFGSIISATDPVAVVSLLKELGVSKRLTTMIEGESMLNDGTAMVLFLVLMEIVEGRPLNPGQVVAKFLRMSLGGPVLGICFGMIVTFILRRIHNNFVLEVNTTIFACYLMFYLAEFTSLNVSGILALVALGLYMTNTGRTGISTQSENAVNHIWGYFSYVAETLIFTLMGVIMGDRF